MPLQLIAITPDNFRAFLRLRVAEHQCQAVAAAPLILARAYAYRDSGGVAWGIVAGGEPVGLLLERQWAERGAAEGVLDQLLIDAAAQGRGYGTAAVRQWLAQVMAAGCYRRVTLCYEAEFEDLARFYGRLGFAHNGERDGDEVLMEYLLGGGTY